MKSFSKAIGSGIGGTFGTGAGIIVIWLITDSQFGGINMPEAVQLAVSGMVGTVCSIIGTWLAPPNQP